MNTAFILAVLVFIGGGTLLYTIGWFIMKGAVKLYDSIQKNEFVRIDETRP